MAMTVGNWQTWKPEIDTFVEDEKDNLPENLYERVFSVKKVDRLQIEEVNYSGFGPMIEVGELGDAVDDEAKEGYKYAYQRKVYRKSATFSSDLMETDQTRGTVEEIGRDFARVAWYSRNLNGFSLFRNAWNSLYTYGDGQEVVSVSHPRKDGGGNQGNTFTDGVQRALDYDNALSLQDVLMTNLSNTGNLLGTGAPGKNKVLFGPIPLKEQLFQIAGVEGPEGEPDTAENNTNWFRRGDKFDVLLIPWIGWEAATQAGDTTVAKTASTNYWDSMWGIMDAECAKKYVKMFVAQGYEKYDEEITKANQALIKYVYDKYTWGMTHWIWLAASKGDNSTYTG
jgi:hypothetical protein